MFGYITINKPELKIREYETYKGFYCGLCQSLKKSYGFSGQMTLSYDLTFVALLLSSLYEPESQIRMGRCIAHPGKKRMMIENPYTEYAAHMGILLTWYHLRDDWTDEKKLSAAAGLRVYHKSFLKAREKYPEKARHMSSCLARLAALEKKESCDIDRVAGTFGELLGEVMAMKDDIWRDTLYRTGFFLGKYIYLMDAYDDMEKDESSGNYNIFLLRKKKLYGDTPQDTETFEADCLKLLTMMMADCTEQMEKLPCLQDVAILRNILYDGVWNRYHKIQNEKEKQKIEE